MLTKVNRAHRIHVVDVWISMNLIALDSQIASVVTYDDVMTQIPPLPRRIELLIHPSVEAEGRITNSTVQFQVSIPVFNRFQALKLSVASNHRTHEALAPRMCAWR